MNSRRLILHIDDDPQFTRALAARLAIFGIEARPLNDPHYALEELALGQYRVVLLDLDMPHLDGLEVLRQIKTYDGGFQVVVLTDLVPLTTLLQGLRLGAEATLFKPVRDVEPLVSVIDDVFRKLDRWRDALEELTRRKQAELELLAN